MTSSDTCAEWSRANAYIARHQLQFKVRNRGCIVAQNIDRPVGLRFVGHGLSLYQAVLDYQEKSGIGWNS